MTGPRINLPMSQLRAFCERWGIRELALFGSVLRDDFGPASDVDVLVRFAPNDPWSLLDLASMKLELQGIFGREVDLVEEEGLRNPFRRQSILSTKQVIYAA